MDASAPSRDPPVTRDASFIRNPDNASTDSLEALPNYQLFQSGALQSFGSDPELLCFTEPLSSSGDAKNSKKLESSHASAKAEFYSEPTRRRVSLSPDDAVFTSSFSGMKPSSPSTGAIAMNYASIAKTIIEESERSTQENSPYCTCFHKNLTPGASIPARSLTSENFLSMKSIANLDTSLAYPALLSDVAYQFRANVPLNTHTKDMLDYKDSFTGSDAVNTLCTIMQIGDRNLAVILGRALGAQGFIHDVTYSRKLRDSSKEIYKCQQDTSTKKEDQVLPTGVFTLLTDCYVSTCSSDRICYSVSCPRRLAQQLKSQENGHVRRTTSVEQEKAQLWYMSVPAEILLRVTDAERKRQEIIFEVIQTEREFVDDLYLIQTVFIRPLLEGDIIEESRKTSFISSVFLNLGELYSINSKLKRKLVARQRENPVVETVGDIFASIVDEFYPYIEYGAGQIFAKYVLDEEKANNPEFAKFLKECERNKECRKLPLESFLARPTTRMGRYPLFLKSSIEKLPEKHPDRITVPQALATIRDILAKINSEAGKAENALKLSRLQVQIFFNPGEEMDLCLKAENRKLCREGTLLLKRSGVDVELTVFLFDHYFVLAKRKDNGTYKPIPLELLVCKKIERANIPVVEQTTVIAKASIAKIGSVARPSSLQYQAGNNYVKADFKGHLFSVIHLGRLGGNYVLSAYSPAEQQTWIDAIQAQQQALMESKKTFELLTLNESIFKATNRVNCSTAYSSLLILGTDDGLYVGPERLGKISPEAVSQAFTKVLGLERITQVDVLPDHDMLILLADRTIFTFTLDILDTSDPDPHLAQRRGKKIGTHVSFFKQGICSERTLVCAVKSTSLTATIKVLEPVGLGGNKLRGKFGKLFLTTNDSLRVYKEFYIPTESRSVHFLRTKLCVGCSKGFEIVDLDSLNTQGLLDPTDPKLDFINKRDGNLRPIAIFRIREGEFLLCYNEFGFLVDKLGRRFKEDYLFFWTGYPTVFSYIHPYILAFEPSYVEIRNVESGEIQQIIPTSNLRCLNPHPDFLHLAMDQSDHQEIVKLVLISENYDNL